MLKKPLYHRIIQSCEQVWNLVFSLRSLTPLNIASKTPEFLVCLACPGKPGVTMITVSLKSRINFLVSKDIPDPLFDKHIGLIFPKHFHFKAIAYIFFSNILFLVMSFVSDFYAIHLTFQFYFIIIIFLIYSSQTSSLKQIFM